jgi:hypothetical protein
VTRPMRNMLAGAIATLVLFGWGAISHLGIIRGVGFAAIPEERALVEEVAELGIAPGLYVFPTPPEWRGEAQTESGAAAWEREFRAGPAGLLVVRPHGEAPISVGKLLVQLGANAVAVAFALFVVSAVRGSFWRRVASVAALGLVGLSSVGVIYWNWYAFPDAFFAAQVFDIATGWLLVGLTLAALVPANQKRPRSATPAPPGV